MFWLNAILFAANIDDPEYCRNATIFVIGFIALMVVSYFVSVVLPSRKV